MAANLAKKDAANTLAVYSLNEPAQLGNLATLVQEHIELHKLFTPIQGKKYVNVEGWQFAGAMLGIVPIVENVTDTSTHAVHVFKGYQGKPDTELAHIEFRAVVALRDLRTGKKVGRGVASCTNLESRKRTFDPYAVESMAQTRAVGKAFRLLIGWLMQAGGYATTPAEEMPDAEPETSAAVVPAAFSSQQLRGWAHQMSTATSKIELRKIWDSLPAEVQPLLKEHSVDVAARIAAAVLAATTEHV